MILCSGAIRHESGGITGAATSQEMLSPSLLFLSASYFCSVLPLHLLHHPHSHPACLPAPARAAIDGVRDASLKERPFSLSESSLRRQSEHI